MERGLVGEGIVVVFVCVRGMCRCCHNESKMEGGRIEEYFEMGEVGGSKFVRL